MTNFQAVFLRKNLKKWIFQGNSRLERSVDKEKLVIPMRKSQVLFTHHRVPASESFSRFFNNPVRHVPLFAVKIYGNFCDRQI